MHVESVGFLAINLFSQVGALFGKLSRDRAGGNVDGQIKKIDDEILQLCVELQ